jgi:hypothetical protein
MWPFGLVLPKFGCVIKKNENINHTVFVDILPLGDGIAP